MIGQQQQNIATIGAIDPKSLNLPELTGDGGGFTQGGGLNLPANLVAAENANLVDTSGSQDPNILQRIMGFLGGNTGQGLLTGGAALAALNKAYGDLGVIGERGLGLGEDLAQTQLEQAQFRPYTVTSAMGGGFGATIDPTTGQVSTTMQLNPLEQAFAETRLEQSGDLFGRAFQDTGERTEDIYNRALAAISPEMERQRLSQEERMAAQGRLGVRSNMFGGMAPEDFALNKAQTEAMANAYLGAMGQAQKEQAQQAALGQQFLGAGYIPQAQLLNALQPGQTAAAQAQQARLYGTGLFGEATASGIDALLGSAVGRANLLGAAGTGLLSGLVG